MSRVFAHIKEVRETFRASGVRGALRQYGWKLIAAVFCYYLVRDLTIYVLVPYLVTKHLIDP